MKNKEQLEIIMEIIKEIDRVHYEECCCNEGSLDYDYIMSLIYDLIKKL